MLQGKGHMVDRGGCTVVFLGERQAGKRQGSMALLVLAMGRLRHSSEMTHSRFLRLGHTMQSRCSSAAFTSPRAARRERLVRI